MERVIYGALSSGLEPVFVAHLKCRRWRGLEHPTRWRERLGFSRADRPPGALIWFHAVSLGEGLAAIPIINKCMQMQPLINILLTTGTLTAFYTLKCNLPQAVLCQFAPIDTPTAVERFLAHWHPQAGIFMESELWPNLLLSSSLRKIPLALLNARISEKSFRRWSQFTGGTLIGEVLSNFALICPLSTVDAVRLQILGASPKVIHFCGNSKYAWGNLDERVEAEKMLLKGQAEREVWIAASTHPGEEEAVARVHVMLKRMFPKLLTVIAPRHPRRANTISKMLQKTGLKVAQRSFNQGVSVDTDIYLADTTGELKKLYSSVPVAFVGGSLMPGLTGHNIAEPAACGCAVLTGPHLGHFKKMLKEMQSISTLSIQQISSETSLVNSVAELFSDSNSLQSRREAARRACIASAAGVVHNIYKLLELYVLPRRNLYGSLQVFPPGRV